MENDDFGFQGFRQGEQILKTLFRDFPYFRIESRRRKIEKRTVKRARQGIFLKPGRGPGQGFFIQRQLI
jgi:hypothetical protein